MKKAVFKLIIALIFSGMPAAFGSGSASAELIAGPVIVPQDNTLDVIVLLPGDSRSIEFEYNDTFWDPESYHVALISTVSPDNEIRRLTINIDPTGNVGSDIAYFTWGAFVGFPGAFFEILAPKFTYGHKEVTYIVDISASTSTGFLFSAAMVEYSHFDFPLNMTMTLTLSN